MAYQNLNEVITLKNPPPEVADSLVFSYRDIEIHAYGILHGITGATNKAYLNFVNKTIEQSPGLRMGEKGMLKIYRNIDGELEDWLPVSPGDVFWTAWTMTCTPARLFSFIRTIVRERTSKQDRFGVATGVGRLEDIGGSPYFHMLAPLERRELAGFPAPDNYLRENLKRKAGDFSMPAIRFPDPDWQWMALVEPYSNIPLRSIHMLEFATETAKMRGHSVVSIFVGEIHNTDMQHWASRHTQLLNEFPKLQDTVTAARDLAHASKPKRFVKRIPEILSALGGMAWSLAPIPLFFVALKLLSS